MTYGILTADETLFAGAAYDKDNDSYYTMSLERYHENVDGNPHFWGITNGTLSVLYGGGTYSLRPAIVLKNDTTIDQSIACQNGTQTNPYEIK